MPMQTTAPRPITEITTSARRRRRTVRRGTTACLAALAFIAPAAPTARGTTANTSAPPVGGCALTPSADSMPFDVATLAMTVRTTDGVIEMLHDARCTDGRTGTAWIAGDIIP